MRSRTANLALLFGLTAALPVSGQRPLEGREPVEFRRDAQWRRENGHGKVVTALVYTPDSKTLAAASMDGSVRLWDAEATKVLRTLKTSSLELYALAISPDGKLLASAGSWGEVQIWDIASGQEVRVLKGHDGPVAAVTFSPDGKLLATCGYDKSIRIWDTTTWKEQRKITAELDRVTSVAFSPDGKMLASGGNVTRNWKGHVNGQSDVARLWEVSTGRLMRELPVRGGQVAFAPDGHSLISRFGNGHTRRTSRG
jgi:uncharacterized protein with WD repeat